jgi:hypothetical protein
MSSCIGIVGNASVAFKPFDYSASISRLGTDGFFAHDQYHNTTASGRGGVQLGPQTWLVAGSIQPSDKMRRVYF